MIKSRDQAGFNRAKSLFTHPKMYASGLPVWPFEFYTRPSPLLGAVD